MKPVESDNKKQTGCGGRREGERSFLFPSGAVLRLLLPLFFCLLLLCPAILHAALVNGNFSDGLTGWEATGSVYPDNGVAVMREGEKSPVSLVQEFTLNTPIPSLSISLSVKLTSTEGSEPPDVFQVFLLNGNVALAGQIDAANPGEILRIQSNGTVYYAPGVSIAGAPASGNIWSSMPSTFVMTVDLSMITTDVTATLTFDLTHLDTVKTSEVRIDNVLTPPTAVSDSVGIAEDSLPAKIAIIANDIDPEVAGGKPDPATATVTIASTPTNGTVSVQTDKTVLYTPNFNFFGTDSFTYTVTDSEGGVSNAASVTITVTAVNDLPVAVADTVTTNEDTAVVVAVLTNDTDVEGAPGASATVTIVSNPAHGAVSVETDKTVLYTPNSNFFGTDSFTYTVTDSEGGVSNAATVTVTVTAVNDLPVAVADTATTNEDTAVAVAVLSNDADVEGVFGASATVAIASNPTNGTVSVETDKTVLYTPNFNFFGTDSFTYTVTDSEGGVSNAATVTVTVNAVNDAPFASAGADQAVLEGFTVMLDGSLSSDPESGFGYTWSQLSGPTVSLSAASAVKPTFTVPAVGAAGALLIFQLKIADSGEPPLEATDTVSVRIVDFVNPCDANDDKGVNVGDAVLMLREMIRLPSGGVSLNVAADVDGDGKLGIPEAICALQTAAALRNVPDRDGDGDGYTPLQGDCNDGNPEIHPGAAESCNGIDDNCNGLIDEGIVPAGTYYRDADGDGYGDPQNPFQACRCPPGFVSDHSDSDDGGA
jgi:hypothetical protein